MATPLQIPVDSGGGAFPSYYRARYYDPAVGRLINEDPKSFGAGGNFYRYVSNRPTVLVDPSGQSPKDVQRIQAACQRCTKSLTNAGLRLNGGSSDSTVGFIGSLAVGGLNDLLSWFTKKQSCYSQAVMTQECLPSNDPMKPYDDQWTFVVTPTWGGSHRVVEGYSSNMSDPVVVCDPWLNRAFTYPSLGQMFAGKGDD